MPGMKASDSCQANRSPLAGNVHGLHGFAMPSILDVRTVALDPNGTEYILITEFNQRGPGLLDRARLSRSNVCMSMSIRSQKQSNEVIRKVWGQLFGIL